MYIRHVVKNCMRISQTKYRLLQDFTKKMKKEQCYEIINNQIEAIFERKRPVFQLYEVYKIKTVVDFHFRQYNGIQMNIANQIKIIKEITQQHNQMQYQIKGSESDSEYTEAQHFNFIDSMKNLLNVLHCQLIIILSLSNHSRLKQYLKDKKTPIIPLIQNPHLNIGSEFMFRLLKSLGYTFVGNLTEAISQFIQLINTKQPSIDQIELPFLCLIVLKSFQLQSNPKKPNHAELTNKSRDLIFKFIKNVENMKNNVSKRTDLTQQDFESIDIQYCLNAWMSYRFDRPVQYKDQIILGQFLGCAYFIAENKFINKKHQQAIQDIKFICHSKEINYNQLKYFIQLAILYDQGKYKQLIQNMESIFEKQYQSTLPQWDKVTYDIYILTKKAYQKRIEQLKKEKAIEEIQVLKESIQQLQQEIIIFRKINQLQTNPALSWYFFPSFFRVLFQWPILLLNQTSQLGGKRRRGKKQ